jgi:hypothetical protein
LVVRGDIEAEGNFEVPDANLVGFSTVSTIKRRLSAGEYCYIFRIEQWKSNGFLFTKIGKF